MNIRRLKREALKQRVTAESAEPTAPEEPGVENPGDGTNPDMPTNPGGARGSGSAGSGATGSGTDSTEKYTVAWYLPNGNPIIWHELSPGETIPDAPQPSEGYYWHPYPSVMPNHDLDIMPEPIKA